MTVWQNGAGNLSPFLTERIKTKIAVIEQKKETSILNK